jgi:hypothetical protein
MTRFGKMARWPHEMRGEVIKANQADWAEAYKLMVLTGAGRVQPPLMLWLTWGARAPRKLGVLGGWNAAAWGWGGARAPRKLGVLGWPSVSSLITNDLHEFGWVWPAQSRSNPVKPSQTQSNRSKHARSNGQGLVAKTVQSNPVKPSQTSQTGKGGFTIRRSNLQRSAGGRSCVGLCATKSS